MDNTLNSEQAASVGQEQKTQQDNVLKSTVSEQHSKEMDGSPSKGAFTGGNSKRGTAATARSTAAAGYEEGRMHHAAALCVVQEGSVAGMAEEEVLKQLVNSSWCGLLAALSTLLEACTDEAATESILQAFQVSGHYDILHY